MLQMIYLSDLKIFADMKTYKYFLAIAILTLPLCGQAPITSEAKGEGMQSFTQKKPPIALVIGEDISSSFREHNSIDSKIIRDLCNIIAESDRGGVVNFCVIGNPTPRGCCMCEIESMPPVAKKPERKDYSSLYEYKKAFDDYNGKKDRIEKDRNKIQEKNTKTIEDFIRECNGLLIKRGTRYTDLNGFFEESAVFLRAVNVKGYDKWLYCNTDGKHDVGSGKPKNVRCDLLPRDAKIFFSGCKDDFPCVKDKPDHLLSMPKNFVSIFKNENAGEKNN